MTKYLRHVKPFYQMKGTRKIWFVVGMATCLAVLAATNILAMIFPRQVSAQQPTRAKPIIVQPGAPGKPTRILPSTTKGKLPPASPADVQFMQGMIMHHAQAVEMTALIDSHTENKNVRSLGARISRSQSDEIKFMKRWLAARGQDSSDATSHHSHHSHLMPGMLTAEQMDDLKKATDADFDRLFLQGMIQHHGGALIMVKELFDKAGAGQDAELFNFATDVDSGQRAEIRIMQNLMEKNLSKEKR